MRIPKKAILLVGSPRGPKSTSELLGTYLLKKLQQMGFDTEKVWIQPSLKSDEGRDNLLASADQADILIISFPLYVDSLPSAVIKAMEIIAEHRRGKENLQRPRLLAISNNGFFEANQNNTALAICRRFALETGMEWVGGCGVGGGEAVGFMGRLLGAKSLEKLGFMSRRERNTLDLIAEFLATPGTIPKKEEVWRVEPSMPKWLFAMIGTIFLWRRQAKKNKVWERVHDRPYQI